MGNHVDQTVLTMIVNFALVIGPIDEQWKTSSWIQPPPEAMLADDKHVLMTREAFDALLSYSATIPTAIYKGKMWKAFQDDLWELRFWTQGKEPNTCSPSQRLILIGDAGPIPDRQQPLFEFWCLLRLQGKAQSNPTP